MQEEFLASSFHFDFFIFIFSIYAKLKISVNTLRHLVGLKTFVKES